MAAVTVEITQEGFEGQFGTLIQEVETIEADETYDIELLDTKKKHSFLGEYLKSKACQQRI